MNGKVTFSVVAVLISAVILAGFACASGRASGAAVAGERGQATTEDGERRAALELGGKRGTEFSATCVVDGKKRTFEGETPERLEFSPGDGRLECRVRKEEAGNLKLAFVAGENTRALQQIGTPEGEVKIIYKDGNLSISTVSSSGSSSRQTIVPSSFQSVVSSSRQIGP